MRRLRNSILMLEETGLAYMLVLIPIAALMIVTDVDKVTATMTILGLANLSFAMQGAQRYLLKRNHIINQQFGYIFPLDNDIASITINGHTIFNDDLLENVSLLVAIKAIHGETSDGRATTIQVAHDDDKCMVIAHDNYKTSEYCESHNDPLQRPEVDAVESDYFINSSGLVIAQGSNVQNVLSKHLQVQQILRSTVKE